ncbi:MAG: hypothetical protein LBU65_07895 [Planctomycetaceae bacterium]|nr:hypothetical protein [Planctomycetaceae bacterium]
MSEIFLWAVKIQCSVFLILSTLVLLAEDEYVIRPRQLSNISCPPRYLVNMDAEARYTGIAPYILFETNPKFKKESNFVYKKTDATIIHDFSDNTKNLNDYTYFFSEMNNVTSSVEVPIQKFIYYYNKNISPSSEHEFNVPVLSGEKSILKMEVSPISFCVKVTNARSMFPPRIHQELLLLFYFEEKTSTGSIGKKWGLSYLTSSRREMVGIWEIGFIYVHNEKTKENCVLDGIRFFNEKPTENEIREFLFETDFGNYSVYNFTEYSSAVNVTVLSIFLYPPYEYLKEQIESELPSAIKKERIKVYNEVLRGLTSTQMQL